MSDERTHASFFSGVGGLDMGLERAGWRTVSFSEIDPYASAVLAERWPGVPNLGDITNVADRWGKRQQRESASGVVGGIAPDDIELVGRDTSGGSDTALVQSRERASGRAETRRAVGAAADREWHRASLWTGGFPCQDLSVAGKRRGMGAGTRSGLAYAFLDLVGRHRPRFVLLENVPGLLSSHGGRDMAALIGALVELGYGVGYRVLDARHFGVPQRRRRVFILGVSPGGRAGAERAAEVLSVGSRCRRHPPTGIEAGPGVAAGTSAGALLAREGKGVGHNYPDDHLIAGHGSLADGATSTRTLGAAMGHHGYTMGAQDADGGYLQVATADGLARSVVGANRYDDDTNTFLVGSSPDPHRMRAPHGLAGGPHDRDGVAVYRKATKAHDSDDWERWERDDMTDPLTASGLTPRTDVAIVGALREHVRPGSNTDHSVITDGPAGDDPLLPLGLDSHRYRCCGNGVVADVSEWIGQRLAALLAHPQQSIEGSVTPP